MIPSLPDNCSLQFEPWRVLLRAHAVALMSPEADGSAAGYIEDVFYVALITALVCMSVRLERDVVESDHIGFMADLRMLIDAVLTAYAQQHVGGTVCTHLLRGRRLSDLATADGQRLSYSFLSRALEEQLSGEPIRYFHSLYEDACAGIHFSHLHLFAPMSGIDSEDRSVNFFIADRGQRCQPLTSEETLWCAQAHWVLMWVAHCMIDSWLKQRQTMRVEGQQSDESGT